MPRVEPDEAEGGGGGCCCCCCCCCWAGAGGGQREAGLLWSSVIVTLSHGGNRFQGERGEDTPISLATGEIARETNVSAPTAPSAAQMLYAGTRRAEDEKRTPAVARGAQLLGGGVRGGEDAGGAGGTGRDREGKGEREILDMTVVVASRRRFVGGLSAAQNTAERAPIGRTIPRFALQIRPTIRSLCHKTSANQRWAAESGCPRRERRHGHGQGHGPSSTLHIIARATFDVASPEHVCSTGPFARGHPFLHHLIHRGHVPPAGPA
jgi:hypothetical protein